MVTPAKRAAASDSDSRQVEELMFRPLGSGNEVGRSCHILEYKGTTVMLDCGIHPGRKGEDALPFFDEVDDLSKVDLCLITHFHLDHIAALPYLYCKTDFKGRVFMTHPTKAVARLLLMDYVRVGKSSRDDDMLFDEKDVERTLNHAELIDYHQELTVNGVKFQCYNAGHVLGAAMFTIEIAGASILYTGDFSCDDDRHLRGAEVPHVQPDVMICESTYGVQVHEPRNKREARFTEAVETVVKRGGRCLIPVFSLGRAQELLLILEEHWEASPSLRGIPIYHASRLASKALGVFEVYIRSMNDHIQEVFDKRHNPWQFRHISNLVDTNSYNEIGPAVVMASPGMLQNGASRRLFEQWCEDKRNGVVLAGYCVQGTLAKKIMSNPKEITTLSGQIKPMNCEVKYVSFAAHSDFVGTNAFIKDVKPKRVVLVHGEANEMRRLKEELVEKFRGLEEVGHDHVEFLSPTNGTLCRFEIHEERIATAYGRLATKRSRLAAKPHGGIEGEGMPKQVPVSSKSRVAGFLVTRDFKDIIIAPDELAEYTQLSTTVVEQQLHVPFHSNFDRLKLCVGKLFDDVQELAWKNISDRTHGLCIHQTVTLTHTYPPGNVLVQWDASPKSDMIADAVVALLMQAEGGISGVRMKPWCPGHHNSEGESESIGQSRDMERAKREDLLHLVEELTKEYYGEENVTFDADSATALDGGSCVVVSVGQCRAVLNVDDGVVEECTGGDDANVVHKVLGRLLTGAKQASGSIQF